MPVKLRRRKSIAIVVCAIVVTCAVVFIAMGFDSDRDESTSSEGASAGFPVQHFRRQSTSGLFPVTGTLTVDGKPAKRVVLHFYPIEPAKNPIGTGVCDAVGRFTPLSGLDGHPGMVAGRYRIVLVQTYSADEYAMALRSRNGFTMAYSPVPWGAQPTFHSKYRSVYTSDREVMIEHKANSLHLDVDGPEY
jgi:hypothetical protein